MCRNCGKLGHKAINCKARQDRDGENDDVYNSCKKPDHVKTNCFKLMKKKLGGGNVELSSMTKADDYGNDVWIVDSEASCHYCNDDEALHNCIIISTATSDDVMIAKKNGRYYASFCRKVEIT